MAKRRRNKVAAAVLALLVFPVAGGAKDAVTVSAAVSLRDVLNEIWQPNGPGRQPEIVMNAAGSGTLVRQIIQGAPVDLFVSASPVELDELDRAGLLVAGSRRTVASNRLITIFSPGGIQAVRFGDLAGPGMARIAIGNPRTVPAGRYAQEALQSAGIWDRLQDRLIYAENVRQVVEYVARGDADAGMVYLTDAGLFADRIVTGPEPPAGSYPPILYQAAILKESTARGAAENLLEQLLTPDGRQQFLRYGFTAPVEQP